MKMLQKALTILTANTVRKLLNIHSNTNTKKIMGLIDFATGLPIF
jgi:hypothetical protein